VTSREARRFQRRAAKAQERRRKRLENLLSAHTKMIFGIAYRLARRICGQALTVEDLVQTGYIALITTAVQSMRKASSPGYLQARITGAMMDEIRDRAPLSRLHYQGNPEDVPQFSPLEELAPFQEPAAKAVDPLAYMIQTDTREKLLEALKYLPVRDQAVMLLHYFNGLSMKRVGNALGLTESRISQIHAKALVDLRVHLAGEFGYG